jgi:integrase
MSLAAVASEERAPSRRKSSGPLSATQVASLTTPGVHRVDRGLYLQVLDSGARSWLLRYQLNGRPRVMGLGPLHLVPLTAARAKAIIAQRQLLDGVDPIETRRAERRALASEEPSKVPTFATCAAEYLKAHATTWSNAKHVEQWERTLASYAGPIIGHLPVDAITVEHVVQVLEPIWTSKSETAGRLRGRIEKVLGWAEAKGYRSGANPAMWKGPIGHMLPALSKVQKVEHHQAVAYADVPKVVDKLRPREGNASKALQFLILTAARSGEVRGMQWGELDLEAKTWTIPADRMKAREEHVVPLSDAAITLLPSEQDKADALVFPGTVGPNTPLSDMTLLKVVRTVWSESATVHGLRSSFRDWAAEQTDFPREIAEAALAHNVGTEVERAYLRTSFFDKRRDLMTGGRTS